MWINKSCRCTDALHMSFQTQAMNCWLLWGRSGLAIDNNITHGSLKCCAKITEPRAHNFSTHWHSLCKCSYNMWRRVTSVMQTLISQVPEEMVNFPLLILKSMYYTIHVHTKSIKRLPIPLNCIKHYTVLMIPLLQLLWHPTQHNNVISIPLLKRKIFQMWIHLNHICNTHIELISVI